MRRSIATVSLSGTLHQKLAAARRAGFDGIEIFENDLLACPAPPAEVRRWCDDLGLTVDLYQPFRDFEAVDEATLAANLRRAHAKFEVMERLGAHTVLVCSSVSPEARDDDDLAAEHLHLLASAAAEHNVRVAYEALAWGRHVDLWRHSHRIVTAADHPHLGICLDSFHVLSRGDSAPQPGEIDDEKLFFVQLADAPHMDMDVLQWSRHYRCFPGQGSFDLTGFVADVLRNGYHGPLSLEVFNDVFRQADTGRTATDAMRSLLHLEEAVDGRLTIEGAAGTRERLELFAPPAPPAVDGLDFVEIGVADRWTDAIEEVLRALGFQRRSRHRTKAVECWVQGEVAILVNRGADAADGRGVGVAALGIRTEDPRRSGNRAEAFRAPAPARRRGVGEVEFPTAVAPDGTVLLFTASAGPEERAWSRDFAEPATPTTPPGGRPRLRAIDHVAVALSFEQFDEGVLFFRAVLGLGAEPVVQVADTHGLLRSRALSDDARTIRIALTVPLLGGHEHGHEFQHVAFATDDIFAAVADMRRRGIRLLDIPDNYYDDIAARTELEPSLLARLRDRRILYDTSDAGSFLHAFTEPVGGLFFEVIERQGDYDGYGAPNAGIRLAALRTVASA
ncbi:MAG TPA: TIM barrel protein [Egicoccus sp.]|nr:TIM barrel protein [Egicoccus sp.]HSK24789.1 TIM barrel protein [Egicoccus sp.]